MKSKQIIKLTSLADTVGWAQKISQEVKPGMFLLLVGDLGAGKTTFTKFLLSQLGVQEKVTSPSFVIMNEYETSTLKICHLDAYRLSAEEDLLFYLDDPDQTLNIIEWPYQVAFDYHAYPCLQLTFEKQAQTQERVLIMERNY